MAAFHAARTTGRRRAQVAGRAVFVIAAVMTGAGVPTIPAYLQAASLPGLVGAVAQVLLLPAVAAWWTRRESRR